MKRIPFAAVLLVLLACQGRAAVLYVDINSTNPIPPFVDWSTAATNIQDAVDMAAASDEILVSDGVYQVGGRSVDGSVTNRVAVTIPLVLQSLRGPAVTVIDGGSAFRCAYLADGAQLVGFTLTNGRGGWGGGGLSCQSTNATVTNCVITAGFAAGPGGAQGGTLLNCVLAGNTSVISGGGAAGSVLDHCIISNNVASNGGGVDSSLLFNCVLTSNQASGSGGGANNCTLTNCLVSANAGPPATSLSGGGGLHACVADHCVISGNTVGSAGGGALQSTLTFCLLTNNLSTNYGGGASGGSLTCCTIIGNTSYEQGGGVHQGALTDCLVVSNASLLYGSGVGYSTLTNCTVVGNRTLWNFPQGPYGVGGAVFCSLFNCILYLNDQANSASDSTLNYSCTTPMPSNGIGNITIPPFFVNLAAGDFHLRTNSPCINNGNNDYVTTTNDLDGNPRVLAGTVDIGAYEFQGPVAAIGVTIQADYTNTVVGVPLSFQGFLTRGAPTTTYWDFGDGTVVSNQLSISHAWGSGGYYTVTLWGYEAGNPVPGSDTAIIFVSPQTVQFVAITSTNPVAPFVSWQTAATNIQDAIDLGYDGGSILVSNGIYQVGTRIIGGITNRVAVTKRLSIQSVNGPAATRLDGGAVGRCVYLADGCALSGFTVTNGASSGDGGGVYCQNTNATVSNCFVSGNSCVGAGGGLFAGTLTNCTLRGNSAGAGGGAFGSTLSHCVVSGNSVGNPQYGGGLHTCIAFDSTITGNSSYYGGGAMSCTLVHCTLVGNPSSYGGGACASWATNCIFSSNSGASEGGGVRLSTLENCVLTNNSATFGGAASDSMLIGCTVVNNVAYTDGGGLSSSTADNSIVFYNASYGTSANYSLDSVLNYSCSTPLPTNGIADISGAPIFVNQATGDLHLQSTSPCINMGNNAYVTATTDLDGHTRIFGDSVDMGAYEYQALVPLGVSIQPDYSNTLAGVSVTLTGLVTRGIPTVTIWNLGDGTVVSNQLTVAHSWAAPGDYTVGVTVYNAGTPAGATGQLPMHVVHLAVQPMSQTATLSNSATFTYDTQDAVPSTFSWSFNGAGLTDATNGSLTLPIVQPVMAGAYSVSVGFGPLSGYPPGPFTSPNASLTVTSAVCATAPAGLVAWWRAETNAFDTVGGQDGTLMNTAGFAPGKVGQAFSLDGTNGFVQVPASPLLQSGGPFTVEGWVMLTQPPGTNGATVAMKGVDDLVPADWALSISAVGTLSPAATVNSNWVQFECQTVIQTGLWYHVAMTYDGAVLSGYVNGLLDGSQNVSGAVRSSNNPMKLGAYASGYPAQAGAFLAGEIDELSFYDRGLTLPEIQAVYNGGYAGKCVTPIPPSIAIQPQNSSVLPGATAAFAVLAGGTLPLSYQWLVNGSVLSGQTNSMLTFSNVQYSQSGFAYSVLVTNSGGSLLSTNAVLTVINTPPHLSSIPNQQVWYLAPVVTLPFMVWDAESPASQLQITGASSNTNLVSSTNLVFAGADTNRSVTVTPITNRVGAAVITLTVTDPGGLSAQTNFTLTVTNSPPQISAITNLHVPINVSTGPLPFTVSDLETPAVRLTITAYSSNTNGVPPAQIVFGGTGTNRTVSITPETNQAGSATITLVVTDEVGGTNQTSFTVTVDQFTPLPTGLPALQYGAVAWGDYDGDGALDLLISGSTNGGPSGGITRVYHNDGGQFTNFISLPGLYASAAAWCDYDRDGRLDFVVSGMSVSNIPVTRIYHNNGDGTFTDINAGLTGVYFGSVGWGDYDNDGAPDLIVSGRVPLNAGQDTNVSRLYHNEGDGRFLDIHANLPAPTDGTTAWGDFDNDGRLDLLLVGNLPPGPQTVSAIYRNVGGGVFTNMNAGLPAAPSFSSQLCAAWGDYDNDGLLDVAIANGSFARIYHNTGSNTLTLATSLTTPYFPFVLWGDFDNDGFLDLLVSDYFPSHLYRNNGNGTFSDTRLSLPADGTMPAAWGDVYNAGALDILFDGSPGAPIYRNNNGVPNTPPGAPGSLSSTVGRANTVVFTWSPAVDTQTRSNGLSYNLRVGTTPGGFDVVSPQADPLTGRRRLPAMGNARPTNRGLLINLPAGTYYWSAQAIDTTFAGSPFAPEATFTITNTRPVISPIADQTIAPATPTPPIPFTIGDIETAASNLVLSVQSSDTNVVPLTSIILSGTDSNRTVQITPRTNGVSLITIHVTDEQGAFGTASFLLTATQFIPASANFVPVQNSILAWGDFNNDGRLDVLVAGNTNSNPAGPVIQLYRNDGNGVFTPVPSGLPGVTYGSAAWGDFNNDGQLDLVVTGTTNGQPSGAITRVYRNNSGTLTDIGAALPALSYSSAAWGDFDNDGKLDLLLAGSTNGAASGAITQVYHNNGDGTFSLFASLTGIFQGSVACADLDGDGALDIVITGFGQTGAALTWVFRNNKDGTFTPIASMPASYGGYLAIGDFDGDGRPDIFVTGGYLTRLYRNLGNFTFTNLGVNIPAVVGTSAAWGDFNNDGRLDLVLSGTVNGAGSGAFTRVYLNTGSLVGSLAFSNFPVSLPTNYFGSVTWADFNQDNKLDILVAGTDGVLQGSYRRSQTALFMNASGISNTPPTDPSALSFVRSNTTVLLTWASSTDAQTTNASGLSYDLRVGRTPGGIEVVSPPADVGSGLRRVVQMGAASTTQWQLINLVPGTYYWSVQAIDTSFAGSLFAPEATFVVLAPPIAVPDAIAAMTNAAVTFSASKLTANDIETNGYPLTVTAVSPASARGGAVLLSSNNVTYTPPPNFNGNDSFTYTISDGQSAPAVGIVFVTVGSGGPIALRIAFGPIVDAGDFLVRYSGVPGLTYTIEASSDLSGPWSKVQNITAPAGDAGFGPGVFDFRIPIDHQIRFYRIVFPAY